MKQQTTQTQPASEQAISVAAYYLWQNAGKPAGRDHEFWLKAEAQLKNTVAATKVPTAASIQKATPEGAERGWRPRHRLKVRLTSSANHRQTG